MNFDEARKARLADDRGFTIGGETFTHRAAVAPEALLNWSRMTGGEFVLTDDDGKPVLGPDKEPISTLTEEMALAIYDETVLAFLEPGQEEKWRRVRAVDAELPITVGDMSRLVKWLFDKQAGRPTSPPSGSSPGSESGGTGTTSTGESRSPVAVA